MKKIITFLFLISPALIASQDVTSLTSEFKGSGGLSLDDDGNLIIADFGDFLSAGDGDGIPNKIMILDSELNLTEYSTGFIGASGNDFDSDGILYQSDIGASAIYKVVDGIRTFVTSTGISNPVGITFDSQDNFYVCNCGNNTIRKVTSDGISTQFASGSIFQCPNGITVDEDDNLYVSCFSNGNIIKITPEGETEVLIATPAGSTSGPSNGHLDYFQPTRTLYIASHGANQIFSLDIDDPTDLILVAGSGIRGNSDGDAASATFSRPNGVVVSQTGDSIYVNSAIPLVNTPNGPLNPQIVRLITGVQSTVSVQTLGGPTYNIQQFPNPVVDKFNLEADFVDDHAQLELQITNLNGQILLSKSGIRTTRKTLKLAYDINVLKGGTYLYNIRSEGVILVKGKFIKLK